MTDRSIADLRVDYAKHELSETSVADDPLAQFRTWFDEAVKAELPEPNAMTLATVDSGGAPKARVVLLKGVDERGFTFYTNYESDKARELEENRRAALCFLWTELQRQVRIEGPVTRVDVAESDAYWATRPRASQLGAHASPQSRVVPSRAVLEEAMAAAIVRFEDTDVPRPAHWGGYRVIPLRIELWQGRRSRLHDRIVYLREREGAPWRRERLAP